MRKEILLMLLVVAVPASATRIRNKSGVAIRFLVEGDFRHTVELQPGQEGNAPLPAVNNLNFIVLYRGADPRLAGLRNTLAYPAWRWKIPEVIDIYLDGPNADEQKFGAVPHRLFQFMIDTTRQRERGYTENI